MSSKRLIARYAVDRGDSIEVITRFEEDIVKERTDKYNPKVSSIMPKYPSAIWFERKMKDDFGIDFEGAFDKRPLVHQERFPKDIFPMKKDFPVDKELEEGEYTPYKYEVIGGDGVFEVAVGPIHAGIIEPGHFQFSQAGEDMLHQEVRHFYKYRGIEKMLEGKSLKDAISVISRVSGNESIAYQIALQKIISEATSTPIDIEKRYADAILLEIERIIHHWTDLGFIPNDAGFGAALAYASARAEEARRLMKKLTNSRFGFDSIFSLLPKWNKSEISEWISKNKKDIEWFESWIMDIPSLWDRMDTTGILKKKDAQLYGCIGVVARASGIATDVRLRDELYQDSGFKLSLEEAGDVASRFKVRIAELKNSLLIIENFLEKSENLTYANESAKAGFYESFAESSLGEIYMSVEINEDGFIDRIFLRDPSFINWQALHLMMPGNIIADFPLINKSCDLSYAGNDL